MSATPEPLCREDLIEYFRSGEKPLSAWKIGTEHEKIGVYEDSFERVPFEGERGIGALLERIAAADGWKPVHEAENLIALQKEGGSITLEPGGQLELSGAPLAEIRDTCSEFNTHADLVKRVSEEFGIAWLGLGGDPFHDVSNIPKMPKARYAIMRKYLPTRGRLSQDMMHATATVQANLDYASEADMVEKMRTALGCSPIVSAIFANSSISVGKPNGFISRRVEIWRHTDPDRCGVLPFVFEPDFCYEDYAEWALDVPMFFIVRDSQYLPARGTTFRQFMDRGFADQEATLVDWDLHLTTLFPEVRLKRFIEVRGADTVPRRLICALPAIWKGLLYDREACRAAWDLVEPWSLAQREEALAEVARFGLGAQVAGRRALDLARELANIASAGLGRIFERGESARDERSFLEAVHEQIELGKSPGQVILERWEGPWKARPERLIEYARY